MSAQNHDCKKEVEIRDIWNEVNEAKKVAGEPMTDIRERLKAIEISQEYQERYIRDIRDAIVDLPGLRVRVVIGSAVVSVLFAAGVAVVFEYLFRR